MMMMVTRELSVSNALLSKVRHEASRIFLRDETWHTETTNDRDGSTKTGRIAQSGGRQRGGRGKRGGLHSDGWQRGVSVPASARYK